MKRIYGKVINVGLVLVCMAMIIIGATASFEIDERQIALEEQSYEIYKIELEADEGLEEIELVNVESSKQ